MKDDRLNSRTISTFKRWETESCVRSRPFRYHLSQEDFESQRLKNWFPPDMLPFLSSTHLKNLSGDEIKRLQAAYLVHFLDYTTALEHSLVNRAVENIIHNRTGVFFSDQIREIGLKIYIDEGYHALFSAELAVEISTKLGFPRFPSARIKALEGLVDCFSENEKPLATFLVAFISETIISKELIDLAKHNLIEPIRNMFKDHLHDEARHSQYFSDCFVWLWQQLEKNERQLTANLIPRILKVFTHIDEPWLRSRLSAHSIPYENINRVVEEAKLWSTSRVSPISASTLISIKRTDLLDNPDFYNLFREQGVIP